MSLVNKWLIVVAVALLQLVLTVQAQIDTDPLPVSTTKPPVVITTTTTPKPVVTTPAPTTVAPPIVTTTVVPTTTTVSTLKPPSIIANTTASSTVLSTTTTTTTSSLVSIPTSSVPSSTSISITSASSSATPSASASPAPEKSEKSNTAVIAGSAVGGVVLLALIGGVLACVNRRGGCTKRRDKKKSDFEDYGLGDFPHHRTPAIPPPMVANKPVSPTIPRMNDQGNYYNDDPNYGHYSYQDNNMDYGMQPQQGYYYPQQQHHQQQQQEYYDDGNYYYDSNTSATAYSSVPPMHQQQQQPQPGYAMANVPQNHSMTTQDVYKPDEVGSPISTHANVPHHNR
ncbi:hypothetical protein INT47_003871 [Mucor saturninus]|uniref:Mid2 domain-containing protein n=1 Tax=Mucor saturninus TaxID=64648 RepID=A0A8H7R168_9FUNG|nr:hypothetical protein INT47_003871 [Mucor saturninus]